MHWYYGLLDLKFFLTMACLINGTTLTYQNEDRPQEIDITTGSLDHPESFVPNKDVFIKEKLSWVASVSAKH